MPRPLHIRGMGGLGDNVYQRPLVAHLATTRDVWISTPYPELYEDLPVRPVLWAGLGLRCQGKNMRRQPSSTWSRPPARCDRAQVLYALAALETSIVSEMERRVGTRAEPFRFDLPDFGSPPLAPPYAVVRPVSVRREWENTARNPDPSYVSRAAAMLREAGYRVVCVADLDERQERLVGELPEADRYWIRGELSTRELMALVASASVVVGGVGWIVPTALAYRTPAVIIGGGLGAHNAPHLLVDRRIDGSRMRFLLPEPYCTCRDKAHACPKTIPDFESRFRAALWEVTC